jgi:hypothetical protein
VGGEGKLRRPEEGNEKKRIYKNAECKCKCKKEEKKIQKAEAECTKAPVQPRGRMG